MLFIKRKSLVKEAELPRRGYYRLAATATGVVTATALEAVVVVLLALNPLVVADSVVRALRLRASQQEFRDVAGLLGLATLGHG